VDPFGGLIDLKDGILRAVGAPRQRFAEDPLRLLRAVRFAAQLGFRLEAATALAVKDSADLLRQVSRERILDELNRLLLAPEAARGIRLLADLGLADAILPELIDLRR